MSILTGFFYFNEISSFSTVQYVMFPIGVIITLVGIALLSQREMQQGLFFCFFIYKAEQEDEIDKEIEILNVSHQNVGKLCTECGKDAELLVVDEISLDPVPENACICFECHNKKMRDSIAKSFGKEAAVVPTKDLVVQSSENLSEMNPVVIFSPSQNPHAVRGSLTSIKSERKQPASALAMSGQVYFFLLLPFIVESKYRGK